MSPGICKNMEVDHREYLHLLRRVRKLPGIKKVFIRSGLRYDYIMADKDDTFFKELVEHHVSGQLKVAPEHVSPNVLKYMGKPAGKTYDEFRRKFFKITERLGKKQFIIPYLMSSHPGCKLEDAIMLAEYLRDINYQPEQVQDFYPTPGTLSTTMFYTELDPLTMEEVYIPRSKEEKAMQRALLQFKNPKNYNIVYDALVKAGREDLIGNGPKCLIRDKNSFGKGNNHSNHKSGGRKSRNENSGRRESEDKKRSSHSKKQRGNKSRGFDQKSQRVSKGKKRR